MVRGEEWWLEEGRVVGRQVRVGRGGEGGYGKGGKGWEEGG